MTPTTTSPAQPAVRSILKTRASAAVLKAQEGKTSFTLEIRVAADQSASTFNLASTHLAFLKKLSSVIRGEVYYVPTNEVIDPKPSAFSLLDDFPKTETEHRAFFHRKETTLRSTNQISIKLLHCLITEDNLSMVKKKLLPWLQANRLWMTGETLKKEEISVIAWASGAHADMVHKKSLTEKLNQAMARLQLTHEQQTHAQKLGLTGLPEVFATKRLIQFGNGDKRVSSEVVAVCCVNQYAEFAKNLLVEIPSTDIGFELIPIGFHLLASSEEYREFLMHNNDVTLDLRGITVVNLHPSAWDLPMRQDPMSSGNFNGTLLQYLSALEIIDSIQPTDNSEKSGRWIFIVEDGNFATAQAFLTEFFRDQFPQIVNASYLDHYSAYPRLTFAAPGHGQTMQNRVQSLRQILRTASQPEHSAGLPSIAENAWNRRPKMVFDLSGVQTPAPVLAASIGGTPAPAPAPATNPPQPDSASVTESLAGQSVPKTVQSGDLSTVVSYLDTVLSRQDEQNKRMMDFMTQAQHAQAQQTQAQMQQTQMLAQLITHLTGAPLSLSPAGGVASPPPAKRPATEMTVDRYQGDALMGNSELTHNDSAGGFSQAGFHQPMATQPHHE